jgi:hypothetical protein
MTHLAKTGVFSGNRIHQIRRDPFARASLFRESIQNQDLSYSCHWCGQQKRTLYAYAWVDDSRNDPSSLYPITDYFCSVECCEAYST